jgi:hypothetical protein
LRILGALGVGLTVAGCAQLLSGGGTTPSGPPECAPFALRDTTINVGSAGGQFNLGNDNQLTFSRGAITSGRATYEIRQAPDFNGRRLAAIVVEPVEGAPVEFEEPVTIRISYDGCPFENSRRPMWLVTDDGGSWEKVGGAKSRVGRYVEAAVNHFSAFAIAM